MRADLTQQPDRRRLASSRPAPRQPQSCHDATGGLTVRKLSRYRATKHEKTTNLPLQQLQAGRLVLCWRLLRRGGRRMSQCGGFLLFVLTDETRPGICLAFLVNRGNSQIQQPPQQTLASNILLPLAHFAGSHVMYYVYKVKSSYKSCPIQKWCEGD